MARGGRVGGVEVVEEDLAQLPAELFPGRPAGRLFQAGDSVGVQFEDARVDAVSRKQTIAECAGVRNPAPELPSVNQVCLRSN